MKTTTRRIVCLAAAAILVLCLLAGCGAKTSEGSKNITLDVTYADGSTDEYDISTDAEYLYDAIADTVELTGEDSDYGFYLLGVNGEEAIYEDDGTYWAIYVDGEYGMYGLDSQPVDDGVTYALVHELG